LSKKNYNNFIILRRIHAHKLLILRDRDQKCQEQDKDCKIPALRPRLQSQGLCLWVETIMDNRGHHHSRSSAQATNLEACTLTVMKQII